MMLVGNYSFLMLQYYLVPGLLCGSLNKHKLQQLSTILRVTSTVKVFNLDLYSGTLVKTSGLFAWLVIQPSTLVIE